MLPRDILKEESLIAQLWSQAESYGYEFYEGLYLLDLCKGQSIDLVPINFYPLMQSLVTFLVEMLLKAKQRVLRLLWVVLLTFALATYNASMRIKNCYGTLLCLSLKSILKQRREKRNFCQQ